MNVFKERYSVRNFSEQKVAKEILDEILDIVRLSPTALNHQPYFIYVAQTENGLSKIKNALAPDYGSSTILIVCSDRNNSWQNRYTGQDNILQDIGIIACTILYSAKMKGLDSCYVCNFNPQILCDELELSEGIYPECLIYLGYPTESSKPSERHFQRRKVSEFVQYI